MVVSVSMVSALQPSLRSPSVLGRVADIFGDRNLYRVVVSSSEKQRARMSSASGELAQIAEERSLVKQVTRDSRPLVVWDSTRNNIRFTREFAMSGSAVQPPETRLNRVLVPLRVDTRVEGVLVVGTKKESSPLTLADRQLIVAIANQLAVAVDRQGRAEREARARAVDESDRLKSALVSSVSHELKTPLTAIKMSVTGLFWTTSSTITRTSAANWRSRSIPKPIG